MSTRENWNTTWTTGIYESQHEAGKIAVFKRFELLVELIGRHGLDSRKICELGAGDGEIIRLFLEKDLQITGVCYEWSDRAIEKLKNNLSKFDDRVQIVKEDINPIKVKTFCTLYFSFGVIEHSKNPDKMIDALYDAMPSGSSLILMTPNKFSTVVLSRWILELTNKWTFGYQKEYTHPTLKKWCTQSGFKVLESFAIPRAFIKNDAFLTKGLAYLDRLLNKMSSSFGWYSYVVCIK